jgi:cation diffusion facilitator family transporter
MKDCCEANEETEKMHGELSRVLKIVFVINALMFVFEFSMGLYAHSTSLLSDSLDMFGDALVYGLSLYVLHRSDRLKAKVSFLKGILIGLAGLVIVIEAVYKMFSDVIPMAEVIGWVAICAFITNGVCVLLIRKYREGDLNMRSAYICSRNDMISNIGVIGAGVLVGFTHSKWPDIIVGLIIAVLFFRSAWPIFRDSILALRE